MTENQHNLFLHFSKNKNMPNLGSMSRILKSESDAVIVLNGCRISLIHFTLKQYVLLMSVSLFVVFSLFFKTNLNCVSLEMFVRDITELTYVLYSELTFNTTKRNVMMKYGQLCCRLPACFLFLPFLMNSANNMVFLMKHRANLLKTFSPHLRLKIKKICAFL